MSPNRMMSQISASHHLRNASNASSSAGGGGGASQAAGYSASLNSRRSVSASSDLLQTKLRSLLNTSSLDQNDDMLHDAVSPDAAIAGTATASSATSYSTGGSIKPHRAEKMYDHQAHHMHYASPKKLSQEVRERERLKLR